jgi:hypothetical protein
VAKSSFLMAVHSHPDTLNLTWPLATLNCVESSRDSGSNLI